MTRTVRIIGTIAMVLATVQMAKAQSSALEPYEGAIHSYGWNGLTAGDSYAFYVTAMPEVGSAAINDESVFEFLGENQGVVPEGESRASVEVRWYNPAVGNIYYFWVEMTSATSGCSNYRYVRVSPQLNVFDVISANIPVDNTESCPATSISDGFNPVLGEEYSLGVTTLAFKVSREGGNRAWSFRPSLSCTPGNDELNIVSLTVSTGSETQMLTADVDGIYTVPAAFAEVVVTVSVANVAGSDQMITLTAEDQNEESTMLKDSNRENDSVNHTITVMPIIRGIEGV